MLLTCNQLFELPACYQIVRNGENEVEKNDFVYGISITIRTVCTQSQLG